MKIQPLAFCLLAMAFLPAVFSLTAFAQTNPSCEALAKLALPQTKITSAQIVPAGEFIPPAGGPGAGGAGAAAAAKNPPAFCRVTGVIEPASTSQNNNPPAARMRGKCVARETLTLLKRHTSPAVFRKLTWENGHKLFKIK